MRKNNTSGFQGVSWNKEKKKNTAQISINGKLIRLGVFEDRKKAAIIYKKAAIEYFGKYVPINIFQSEESSETDCGAKVETIKQL